MNFVQLSVDEKLREKTAHGSREFPVAVYRRRMNRKEEGNLILHWHDELQFVVPRKGPILFTAGGRSYTLSERDRLFINSRVLHMAKAPDASGGDYVCINFHPSLLYTANGCISRKYVQPYLSSQALSSVLLNGAEDWHAEADALLERLIEAHTNEEYGYELEIFGLLHRLWFLIVSSGRERAAAETVLSPAEQLRLDRMTAFIRENYADRITLSDVAAAALLSESECCRFARRTLGLPPMRYVNRYRVIQSTELLRTTNSSIGEIALAVGFSSSSYYTERFKETMNCRPFEYRSMYFAAQTEDDA